MPTERTEFIFDQRGGQDVLRTFRDIERSADSASKAFARMNRGARGGSASEMQRISQQTTQASRAMRALQSTARTTGRVMQSAFRGATTALRTLVRTLTSIPRALLRTLTSPLGFLVGGAGAILAGRSAIRAADAYLGVANRIAATNDHAARSTKLLAETQEELFSIANRSRSPIEELAELYGRLSLGARSAAISQKELLRITETVGKSTAIGGGDAASVRGALIQFSQIIGAGGAARGIGQELRSIREQAPYLFITIAEGLQRIGVTASGSTTELEKLAEEGKLTSEQVARAVLVMADEVEDRFKRITPPISQAFTVLRNSWTRFVGTLSARTGAGEALANTIIGLANRLDASAEKFAERVMTVAQTVRRVYFMDLPEADLAKAKAQLDKITGAIGETVSLTMTALGESMFAIVKTAAELFVSVLTDGMSRGVRRAISDALGALSNNPLAVGVFGLASGRDIKNAAFDLLHPADQILELRRQRTMLTSPLSVGDRSTVQDIVSARSALGPGQQTHGDIANAMGVTFREYWNLGELTNVARQVSDLDHRIQNARDELKSLNADSLDGVKRSRALFSELGTIASALGADLANAWGKVPTAIDEVTEENARQVTVLDLLKSKFESAKETVLGWRDALQRAREAGIEHTAMMERKAKEAFDLDLKKTARQLTIAENEYRDAIELTNTKRELGLLSTVEAQRRVLDITREQRHALEGTLSDYERLAESKFLHESPEKAAEVAERIAAIRRQVELLRLEERALDPENFWGGFRQGVSRASEGMATLRQAGEQTGEILADSLGNRTFNAMESIINGTESASEAFRKMAASILTDVARMIFQLSVFSMIQKGLGSGGLLGGLFANGAAFNAGQVTPHAYGAAFSGGRHIHAFANGGIVDRPTIFPMANGAGLMGEAGPEAVMPLDRDDQGRLGVRAQGGGQNVTVRSINVFSESDYDQMASQHGFDQAIARMIKRGGATSAAVRGVR